MKIYVKNNDVSKALQILKKKLFEEGETRELRDRQFFIPKSEQKRIDKRAAEKRWVKKRAKIEKNRIRAEANAFKNRKKRQTTHV